MKYIFLIVFIFFICVADPSSLFLDDDTLRLLYRSDEENNEEDVNDPGKTIADDFDADNTVEEKIFDDKKNNEEKGSNYDINAELAMLQSDLETKSSGTNNTSSSPDNIDLNKMQTEFVDDIYEEWGSDGSTN